MSYSGPAHQTGGKDILFVDLLGSLDTIGRHDNGPWKFGEFLALSLPGGSIVSVKVSIFFEFWIAVTGEHLAVGIDINSFAFALL